MRIRPNPSADPERNFPPSPERGQASSDGSARRPKLNRSSQRPSLSPVRLPGPSGSGAKSGRPQPPQAVDPRGLQEQRASLPVGDRPADGGFASHRPPQLPGVPGGDGTALSPAGLTNRLILAAIHGYRAMPVIAGCRFYPSCSHYAEEAILRKGTVQGIWLTLRRMFRCRPFAAGGWDPVP